MAQVKLKSAQFFAIFPLFLTFFVGGQSQSYRILSVPRPDFSRATEFSSEYNEDFYPDLYSDFQPIRPIYYHSVDNQEKEFEELDNFSPGQPGKDVQSESSSSVESGGSFRSEEIVTEGYRRKPAKNTFMNRRKYFNLDHYKRHNPKYDEEEDHLNQYTVQKFHFPTRVVQEDHEERQSYENIDGDHVDEDESLEDEPEDEVMKKKSPESAMESYSQSKNRPPPPVVVSDPRTRPIPQIPVYGAYGEQHQRRRRPVTGAGTRLHYKRPPVLSSGPFYADPDFLDHPNDHYLDRFRNDHSVELGEPDQQWTRKNEQLSPFRRRFWNLGLSEFKHRE